MNKDKRVKSLQADFEGIMPGTDQSIYDVMNEKCLTGQCLTDKGRAVLEEQRKNLVDEIIDTDVKIVGVETYPGGMVPVSAAVQAMLAGGIPDTVAGLEIPADMSYNPKLDIKGVKGRTTPITLKEIKDQVSVSFDSSRFVIALQMFRENKVEEPRVLEGDVGIISHWWLLWYIAGNTCTVSEAYEAGEARAKAIAEEGHADNVLYYRCRVFAEAHERLKKVMDSIANHL